jgi:hypothetical protein
MAARKKEERMLKSLPWRSRTAVLVAVVIVSAVGLRAAGAAELLTNPGFETGSLAPWTTDGTWGIETTNCHTGSYCASDVGNWYIQQTFPGVPTSDITSITVWIRQPDVQISWLQINYSDSTNDGVLVYPTAAWMQVDMTTLLDPGKFLTGIRLYGYSGPGSEVTVIDDVSIQGTRIEPVIPLLGWPGLLALAALLAVAGAALARQRLA